MISLARLKGLCFALTLIAVLTGVRSTACAQSVASYQTLSADPTSMALPLHFWENFSNSTGGAWPARLNFKINRSATGNTALEAIDPLSGSFSLNKDTGALTINGSPAGTIAVESTFPTNFSYSIIKNDDGAIYMQFSMQVNSSSSTLNRTVSIGSSITYPNPGNELVDVKIPIVLFCSFGVTISDVVVIQQLP